MLFTLYFIEDMQYSKNVSIDAKKITFIPESYLVDTNVNLPVPAKRLIPEWYKDSTSFNSGNFLEIIDGKALKTMKLCMPLFDSLSAGYIQTSWCDIHIERNKDELIYHYSDGPEIIGSRDVREAQKMPTPNGYEFLGTFWNRCWGIKTPKGYSTLITHPFYRNDLPFISTSGIIDTDTYHLPGKVSFFIRKDFEGIIKEGTPLFQIIPFKRDNWQIEKENYTEELEKINQRRRHDIFKKFVGRYKNAYWSRKDYN
jgi:hypothetical protein